MTLLYPNIPLEIAAVACLISLVVGMAIGAAAWSKSDE
jgi:hypothetical protein